MPRLLIAGCGFLGEAAAGVFLRSGWEVEAWTASPDSAAALSRAGIRATALDFTDAAELWRPRGPFDAVLHCASSRGGGEAAYARIYRDGLANLAAAFPAARLIFTSSTSVYAQTDGSQVTECSQTRPAKRTGTLLLEAEGIAQDARGVVLRLAGLYGPGRSVLMSRYLAQESRLEDGGGRWINQIHRDDAAEACLLATKLEPGIYNVCDDRPATQREIMEWLAEYFGGSMPPEGAANPNRRRGVTSKRVSNAKLRAAGWVPRFPSYQDALPSVAASLGQRSGEA